MATDGANRFGDVPNRYHEFKGGSKYSDDRGILVYAQCVAIREEAFSDDNSPILVKTHASIGYREMQVAAAKFGAPPVLPAACNTPDGDQILSYDFKFLQPTINAGQDNFEYGAVASYMYVQSNFKGSGANLIGGARGSVEQTATYQSASFPYAMDLIDFQASEMAKRGILGGAGSSAAAILSPTYFSYSTVYSSRFFSVETAR